MLTRFEKKDFVRALCSLSIPSSAVVLTSASFFELGVLIGANTREQYRDVLCSALREALGDSCTLVGNTFTTDTGRYGRSFIFEETTTTTGFFNDWLLQQPSRVRSLHPINSVTALGPKAEAICTGVARTNYGYNTPYWRMVWMENAWILRIGGVSPYINGFAHLAEAVCGVPYLYNKWLDVDVFVDGKIIDGPWFALVRHLHLNMRPTEERVRRLLESKGLIQYRQVGASCIAAIPAKAYFETVATALSHDPLFFMEETFSIPHGPVPRDGKTEGRDGVKQRARLTESAR